MSKNAVSMVSMSTVRVTPEDDSVQPEAGESFVSSLYVQQVTKWALAYLVAALS